MIAENIAGAMGCGERGMHISKDILEVKSIKYGDQQNVD